MRNARAVLHDPGPNGGTGHAPGPAGGARVSTGLALAAPVETAIRNRVVTHLLPGPGRFEAGHQAREEGAQRIRGFAARLGLFLLQRAHDIGDLRLYSGRRILLQRLEDRYPLPDR